MKIIYVDMDDTLCDYSSALNRGQLEGILYPQAHLRFFTGLPPICGAISGVRDLIAKGYDVYILTAPSVKNPLSYMEKRLWVELYLPELNDKLIICSNKGLMKGSYLIDNEDSGKGQECFSGSLIHFGSPEFPNWDSVKDYLP